MFALAAVAWRLVPGRVLDPVVLVFVALALGAWLSRRGSIRRRRVGRRIAMLGLLGLYVASTPLFASRLVRAMSTPAEPTPPRAAGGERTAIVLLAGGMRTDVAAAPASERLTGPTVQRVIGAARLYREVGASLVLVSGGHAVVGDGMRELLVRLGVPSEAVAVERDSLDTKQNAERARDALRAGGFARVVLVTSALHMRRASWEFERAGLPVVEAPVDFAFAASSGLPSLVPSAGALGESHAAMHELFGRLKP